MFEGHTGVVTSLAALKNGNLGKIYFCKVSLHITLR